MKVSNFIKFLLILLVSTTFIFCFTFFGAKAYEQFTGDDSVYGKGTMISSVDIAGKSKVQAEYKINTLIDKWKKDTSITFTYKEKKYQASTQMFDFNPYSTLTRIQSGQENEATVKISQELLQEELFNTSKSIKVGKLNIEQLSQDMLAHARTLTSGDYTYKIDQYMTDNTNEMITISSAKVTSQTTNEELETLVSKLPVIQLKEKTAFSLKDYLEESGHNAFTDETLSMLATGIYNTILSTNFIIAERNISEELPSYAHLGFEAKYSAESNMDLAFVNENETAFLLELSYEGNALTVVLKGPSFLYDYKVKAEKEQSFAQKTVIQFNPAFKTGEFVIKDYGRKGKLIQIYRITYDEDGVQTSKELLSEDFYAPRPRIEIHSLITPPPEVGDDLDGDENKDEESDQSDDQTDDKPKDDDAESGNPGKPDVPDNPGSKPVNPEQPDNDQTEEKEPSDIIRK